MAAKAVARYLLADDLLQVAELNARAGLAARRLALLHQKRLQAASRCELGSYGAAHPAARDEKIVLLHSHPPVILTSHPSFL